MTSHLPKSLLGSPTAAVGTLLVVLVLAVALFAPLVAPYGPNAIDVTRAWRGRRWRIGSAPTISAETSSAG